MLSVVVVRIVPDSTAQAFTNCSDVAAALIEQTKEGFLIQPSQRVQVRLSRADTRHHHQKKATVEVIECAPFVSGRVSASNTDWVVLPEQEGLAVVDPSLHLAQQFRRHDGNSNDDEQDESSDSTAAGENENNDDDEQEMMTTMPAPLLAISDLMTATRSPSPGRSHSSTAPAAEKSVCVVNIDALTSFALLHVDDRSSSSPSFAAFLHSAVVALRHVQQWRSNISDNAPKSSPLNPHTDLIISPSSVRQLELRHMSRVSVCCSSGSSTGNDAKGVFSEDWFHDERRLMLSSSSSRLSDALDAISAHLQHHRNKNATATSCFAFSFAEGFHNIRDHRRVPDYSSVHSSLFKHSKVRARCSSSGAQQQRHAKARSVVLRPLTRNIVADSIDTAQLLGLRRLSVFPASSEQQQQQQQQQQHSNNRCLPLARARETVLTFRRDDGVDDVKNRNAPLQCSYDSISNLNTALSTSVASDASHGGGSVSFLVWSISADDDDSANEQHEYFELSASTLISEAAPIAADFVAPISHLNSRRSTFTSTSCCSSAALFCAAACRTQTFRNIHTALREVFSSQQKQKKKSNVQERDDDNTNDSRKNPFKLVVISSSQSKIGSIFLVKEALSLLGLPHETCNPALVGTENLEGLASLVCSSAASSTHHDSGNNNSESTDSCRGTSGGGGGGGGGGGVLVLYCGATSLFDHSDVVQWLLSSSKQRSAKRVVLITEAADESAATLALLKTIADWSLMLDEVAAGEDDRAVFMEDLIAVSVATTATTTTSQGAQPEEQSMRISHFVDPVALAESSAGLFFLELLQWLVDCFASTALSTETTIADRQEESQESQESQEGKNGTAPAAAAAMVIIDQEMMIKNLDSFKKKHGHNVTSSKLHEVRWADIGGLEEQREEIMTMLRPPPFLANAKRRAGVLCFGPPGCGKTLLAKAVATECECNFLSVKGPELLNMYVGQSEKNIRDVFRRAREAAPCIVFFDEIDALAPARGAKGDSGGVMDRIVAQLLVELDGAVVDDPKKLVFVMGATNRPDLLDPALLRPGRFDRMCYVGLAEIKADQLAAVKALTRKFHLAPDVDLAKFLADVPCVYTGADYYGFAADAMTTAVSEAVAAIEAEEEQRQQQQREADKDKSTNQQQDSTGSNNTNNDANASPTKDNGTCKQHKTPMVSLRHFEQALENLSPSVPMSELEKYRQLRNQYAAGSKK